MCEGERERDLHLNASPNRLIKGPNGPVYKGVMECDNCRRVPVHDCSLMIRYSSKSASMKSSRDNRVGHS